MSQVKQEWRDSIKHRPQNISEEAQYRYGVLLKYKKLRAKGLSEPEALELLEVKRATYYVWQKRYREQCGTQSMKLYALSNKSRRPHKLRESKIITYELTKRVESIRKSYPMEGKEKVKRRLEQYGIKVSVSTVGRVLKKLMNQGRIENIKKK